MDRETEEIILNYFKEMLMYKNIEEIREKINTYKNEEVTVV